jgi:hypothetical protein
MRNRMFGSRLVLSAQWSSDLFLWGGNVERLLRPAVRPDGGRNSNVEASNVPHFLSREQSLACSLLVAAAALVTDQSAGPAQGFGSEPPHLKPLGMLLPIGNRKVKTGPGAAVFGCAKIADNLL